MDSSVIRRTQIMEDSTLGLGPKRYKRIGNSILIVTHSLASFQVSRGPGRVPRADGVPVCLHCPQTAGDHVPCFHQAALHRGRHAAGTRHDPAAPDMAQLYVLGHNVVGVFPYDIILVVGRNKYVDKKAKYVQICIHKRNISIKHKHISE